MAAFRTMLVLVIAFSVAVLPAVGGFAAVAQPAAAAMSDCPNHSHDGKAMGDCASMAVCAINCFNFVPTVAAVLIVPDAAAAIEPSFRPHALLPYTGSPLFRPPRA